MFDEQEFREWKEEINDVPMMDIIEALDIPSRKNTFLCPNPEHNDTHLGSCVVDTAKNRFRCYACGAYGDNISLVKMYRQKYDGDTLSLIGAGNMVADIAGLRKSDALKEGSGRTRPFTARQMKLLGLKSGKIFCPRTYSSIRSKEESCEYDERGGGYMLGDFESSTLNNLYDEDETTFNYIVIGKLYEKLHGLITAYAKRMYEGLGDGRKREMEDSIETLMPLAEYFMPVSEGYGYDLSFVHRYVKDDRMPKHRYSIEF